jgi:hypothetical protein
VFKAPAALPGAGMPQIIDVTPAKQRRLAAKASPAQTITRRMEKAIAKYLSAEYEKAAAAVA